MNKYILVLLASISSLYCVTTYARDCSGRINVDLVGGYLYDKYTSNETNRTLFEENIIIPDGMSCHADGVEDGIIPVSRVQLKLANGARCSSSNTIPSGVPGLDWELEGMLCQNAVITSNASVRGNQGDYDGPIHWGAGTSLGKIRLIVKDDFWQNAQEGDYNIQVNQLLWGSSVNGSPGVNITHTYGANPVSFKIQNNGTCRFNLSTNALDFGKLSLDEVNSENVFQQFSLYYNCDRNMAINGIKLRLDPEQVVDAPNGVFSATDANGRKLNFRLAKWEERYNLEWPVKLNNTEQIFTPGYAEPVSSAKDFRVRVLKSTPFPAGKVSTYINISLVYM